MVSGILTVTSPDCAAVLVGRMPYFASEYAATFRTDELSRKQAFTVSAVGILEFLLNTDMVQKKVTLFVSLNF